MKMLNDVEKFKAIIVQIGDSQGIIIPASILKYSGFERGDVMQVWIKRVPEFEVKEDVP